MNRRTTNLALAGSVAAAIAMASLPANAADMSKDMEKCYGVAMAGHNDCKAAFQGATCAGSQKADYDGRYFKLVAKGTCTTMKTPNGMGSLTPVTQKM